MNGKNDDPQLSDQHLSKYKKIYLPGRGIERYNNSLKNLLPVRRKRKENGTMAIDSAGLFSFISMSWMSKFMYQAHTKGLKMEELSGISPYDACDYNAERLDLMWKEELAKSEPEKASFSRVAWRFSRTRIFVSSFILTCSIACGIISNTILMRKLLEYLQSGEGSYEEGVKWALLLTASEAARGLLRIWARVLNCRTGLRLRSACLTFVYRKIVHVNNLGDKNIGVVINVLSNDAQQICDMIHTATTMIEAPLSTAYGAFYILRVFSPMALLGIVVFLMYYPIQYIISRLTGYLQNKMVKISDMRVKLMNEILDCMKLIKMYAWEKRFSDDLLGLREREQEILLKTSYCKSLNASVSPTIPVISTIITILGHVSIGNNLTAAEAFPYVSFVESRFRLSMTAFRMGLSSIVSAGISFNRIKGLLLMENGSCPMVKPILESQAVVISHGTFACNAFDDQKRGISHSTTKKRKNDRTSSGKQCEQQKLSESPDNVKHIDILFDISFEVAKGKLVGICGQVGSGKSSLLLAALGQLRVSGGRVMRDGSCAYVSQQAWITNATLRENILFGAQFDYSRYHRTIHACSLVQDIDMMPGGDQTEIGEKGVNLSGGQKQRVALARALYADRDIYLLDDPLSAVDSCVGLHIFVNLILGALRGKTVLFVTHQIQYLNGCDDIYMMRDGRIIEHGTHDELVKLGNEYASMVKAISTDNQNSVDLEFGSVSQSVEDILQPKGCKISTASTSAHINEENVEKSNSAAVPLIVAEKLQQGTTKGHTYHSYIVAAGGYLCAFIAIMIFLINVGTTAFSSWWLALWLQAGGGNTTIVQNNVTIVSDNIVDNPDFSYYQVIYGCTIGMMILTSVLRGLVISHATIRASAKIHNDLFKKIINSPMRFFETTPSGRIQHLFSRDMDEVDNRIPLTTTNLIQMTLGVFLIFSVISLMIPWFILPLCILAIIYYYVSKIFRIAIRDLKRMDNKSRAPVISFVTATVQGLNTIHAFGKEKDFMTKFTHLFDENSKHLFMFSIGTCYLALRIDALSVAITGITAFSVVAFQDQVSPAFAGVIFMYMSRISGVLPHVLSFFTETEARFISVERINHYARNLESESSTNQTTATVEIPFAWPVVPEIIFRNVCMAYGDCAPFILKNISFQVFPGEKIGIVGRTGSGKSSLTVALFRLVELTRGQIEIDNVDISKISLSQLRTKLSIIPQDPVLFSGTLRSNLDPFKLYNDAEIWKALEKTELKGRVQSITGQLDASVGFGGDKFSVGERQLFCLARALLRNSKILILDEATAAVDPETEIVVQNTVQREFRNCTILIIAHRIQTLLPLSRVLVMDDGEVLEFDTPSNLLGDKGSKFSKMMAAAKQAESV